MESQGTSRTDLFELVWSNAKTKPRNKSETFHVFKKFKVMVELQSGYHVKMLRTDRGGEFILTYFI
ncbi:unnamed protein product [Prunus armeniaca]